MAVSIVLAEDAYMVREGVRMLLEDAGYGLAASIENYDELLEAVEAHHGSIDRPGPRGHNRW